MRSLINSNRRLLLTALVGIMIVLFFAVLVARQTFINRLISSVHMRSSLIANISSYTAESIEEPKEIKSVINALSGEREVEDIFILADTPSRVILSSDSKYVGLTISELPIPDIVKRDLQLTLSKQIPSSRPVFAEHRYYVASPIHFTQSPTGIKGWSMNRAGFESGIAFVITNIQFVQGQALAAAIQIVGTFFVGIFIVGLISYWILRKRTIEIFRILKSLKNPDQKNYQLNISTRHLTPDLVDLAQALSSTMSELRHSERRLALALEAGQMAACQWRVSDGKFIWSHNQELFGLSLEEELQSFHDLLKLIHPEDLAEFNGQISEAIQNRRAFYLEFRGLKKDEIRWFACRGRPLVDTLSAELHIVAVYMDIHDRKQVEMELKEHQALLIHNVKMTELGKMAGDIAHEINNPLAIINGRARHIRLLLSKNPIPIQQIYQFTEQISNTVGRIALIVKGLRSLSRNSEYDPVSEIKVQDLLESTLSLCTERFRNLGVQLFCEYHFEKLSTVECREPQIVQILINLLNNSLDAIENQEEPWVRLIVRAEESWLYFTVIDNGPPIAEEIKAKLFQPFFTAKVVGKGTGLGLSISSRLAEAHGGSLYYDESYQNTAFTLCIPILQSEWLLEKADNMLETTRSPGPNPS